MAGEIEIKRVETTQGGEYAIMVEGAKLAAVLTWQRREKDGMPVRLIDSTFTPPESRGQGLAARLVEAVVADARKHGFKIVPQCPYVVSAFSRHPEWVDVKG